MILVIEICFAFCVIETRGTVLTAITKHYIDHIVIFVKLPYIITFVLVGQSDKIAEHVANVSLAL